MRMRVIQSKLEFYIQCSCGLELAYFPHEETMKYFQCPHCKTPMQRVSNKVLISQIQEIEIDKSRTLPSE